MKFLIIGAGNMGQAFIKSILKKKILKPDEISIYEIREDISNKLKSNLKINLLKSIDGSIKKFDIVLLAVKPQVFNTFYNDNIMNKLFNLVEENQVIISIMAGITIEKLKKFFPKTKNIVRVMPNTPALISHSMSVITFNNDFESEKKDFVIKLFKSIGEIEILEEKYFNAVTALSGSGPAFFFVFLEAMIQGGILCGLSKEKAEKLAIETGLGAILMAKNKKNSIEELRHMVTSPAGTTIAGLTELEKNAFRYSVINAIKVAYERAEQLSKL